MYQSRKHISTENLKQLTSDLQLLLQHKKKILCRSLKRAVSLEKLPDAITKRHDAKRRLQALDVAIDIVRHAPSCKERTIGKQKSYELRGKDANKKIVIVHLREEVVQNDRILFFVSCATK